LGLLLDWSAAYGARPSIVAEYGFARAVDGVLFSNAQPGKKIMTTASVFEKKPEPVYLYQKTSGPMTALLLVLIWAAGCARIYKDRDSQNAVFRAWHPVTWLLRVAMVVPCAVAGEKLDAAVPTKLPVFWRLNADQLQWVTPFTRIDSLKPFRGPAKRYSDLLDAEMIHQ
jgi:hypothetical protein